MLGPEHNPEQSAEPRLLIAEATRNHSELFRDRCKRLIHETFRACKRLQDDDNKRLDQHNKDIRFLRKELELKLDEIMKEFNDLKDLQSRVLRAQEACKEPQRITDLCLEERTKRVPSERVHDEVDSELRKEKEIIEGVVSLLQQIAEQIAEQIQLKRITKHQLEQDLKENLEAECTDNSCALMVTHSLNNLQRSKNAQIGLTSPTVNLKQWENFSETNVARAEQENTFLSLRALVESVLQQVESDIQTQVQMTMTAFQVNVQEIKHIKGLMEDQLAKILSESALQQKNREDLLVAIKENQQSLVLAQAKLGARHKRTTKVQCHDLAQEHLRAHINKLHKAVVQSEEEQRALVRCQRELQENIEIKGNSLHIDDVICGRHRERSSIPNF